MATPKKAKKSGKRSTDTQGSESPSNATKNAFPRYPLEKVLRIPDAIINQNAGKPCSNRQAAKFIGVEYNARYRVEVSAAQKFGLIEKSDGGTIKPSELAYRILRPKSPGEDLAGKRTSIMNAPVIGDVYNHYRGENLPDSKFFENALVDNFGVQKEGIDDFKSVFNASLKFAELFEEHNGKLRIVDVTGASSVNADQTDRLKKLGKEAKVESSDTCFVMMPFKEPLNSYYSKIYDPAIRKAGLTPIRADNEIFNTGKIIDQVWRGIHAAKVLVAELTDRNPNVFYELGLAHALGKPVVLVSSNENDVPFDLHHIRVIYYDNKDPFWGEKLIGKVSENVLSAIKNPEEAVFQTVVTAV